MRNRAPFVIAAIAAVALAAGCTAMPGNGTGPALQPSPVVTVVPATTAAPRATVAPGSTEAPPTVPAGVAQQADMAGTAQAQDTEPAAPTSTVAPGNPPTTMPEPTVPPAPTLAIPQIACTPGQLTPGQTEGPYYKQNPPEASNLLQPGMGGTKLVVSGYVLNAACQPVPGARVDFWQADSEGQYDNQGYTLRGWELTDAQGRYSVETVVPGLYPGRTRHIHVKANAPGGPVLTTQLYFPDEPANQRDGIFSPDLVMKVEKTEDGEAGSFNFVINDK